MQKLLERPLRSQLVGWLVGWLSSSNIVFSFVGWFQGAWLGAIFRIFLSLFDHFCDPVSDIEFCRIFCHLGRQHGPNMASFSHLKTFQNRFETRRRFRYPLGPVLALIFGRFWDAKWKFLRCKSCRILRRCWTCRKCTNSINSQAKMPSALFGFIHFRTHFRWKSDVKKASRKTRTWTSIFGGFGWVLGAMLGAKRPLKSCKNDVKKWTKFWRFLDALQDAPGGRFRHPKPPQFYNPRGSLF